MSASNPMQPTATRVAASLAGLAALGWLAWAVAGDGLVQGLYDGRPPVRWLDGLIRWQSIHPVEHYQVRARHAASGLARVLLLSAALLAGWDQLRRRAARDGRGGSEWQRPVWGWALTATGAVWLLLAIRAPLLEALPYWFWHLHLTPLPLAWLAVPAAAGVLAGLAWAATRHPLRPSHVALLVLLGFGWQLSVAAMEGRGWRALTDRLTESRGHAELARAAASVGAGRLLAGYDALLASGELPAFPHATRPPGPLLFLAGLDRLSQALGMEAGAGPCGAPAPLVRLAAVVLPLLSCLVLVPLYWLCRWMVPSGAVAAALGLTVTAPSLGLIALHLDQSLFPLLAWTCAAAWGAGLQRQSPALAAAAGALFYAALFASFGLLALVPALAAFAAVHGFGGQVSPRRLAALTAWAAVGFLALHLVLWLGFGYDAGARLARALGAHGSWKVAEWTMAVTAYLAGLNLLEFALWCGPALSVLAAAEVASLWRERPNLAPSHGAALALVLTLAALAVFGRTAGETARLWLFVLPLAAAAAASRLARIAPECRARWLLLAAAWQLATVVLYKRFQDFF